MDLNSWADLGKRAQIETNTGEVADSICLIGSTDVEQQISGHLVFLDVLQARSVFSQILSFENTSIVLHLSTSVVQHKCNWVQEESAFEGGVNSFIISENLGETKHEVFAVVGSGAVESG